jgi:hypothetical protein
LITSPVAGLMVAIAMTVSCPRADCVSGHHTSFG